LQLLAAGLSYWIKGPIVQYNEYIVPGLVFIVNFCIFLCQAGTKKPVQYLFSFTLQHNVPSTRLKFTISKIIS